jgi:hypothetical protein
LFPHLLAGLGEAVLKGALNQPARWLEAGDTVRAVVDIALVNALMWTATAAIFTGGTWLRKIIIAETSEVTGDIVAKRQIDPRAKALGYNAYE